MLLIIINVNIKFVCTYKLKRILKISWKELINEDL